MKPKFILSKSIALQQYNKAKDICDVVSYSSKTNQYLTPILEDNTDCMFTLHFENELKHIKDKSRVFFLAQGWTKSLISDLMKKNISWFGVDNETDLDTFLDFLNNNQTNKKINLLLRLKLKENTLRTERYFVFGMKAEVINRRIKEIRNNSKINQLGIHFHRKTQNMAEWNYKYEIFNAIEGEVLQMIDLVNIGGGLPSNYANTNVKVLPTIIEKIKEFREQLAEYKIKLIIEPGRFIAAPACKLVTQVIGIHENNIIVNASVYNSDMDAIVVPVKLLVEGELSEGEAYVIKGITPCSMDLFRYRVYLKDVKVGDSLTFLNAGAYNFTTDFCDLDIIETEVVE